jgi:hypothetical protein
MTKCFRNELDQRRHMGAKTRGKEDLEHYVKTNPKLAEKIKLFLKNNKIIKNLKFLELLNVYLTKKK